MNASVAGNAGAGRVSLFVSACQYYVLFLDGKRVGDHLLDVVWTKFAENRSYATYELDPTLLAPGKHALGLMIGQGFCGGSEGKAGKHYRAGLLRLTMHGADQVVVQTVVTDATWSAAAGQCISNHRISLPH